MDLERLELGGEGGGYWRRVPCIQQDRRPVGASALFLLCATCGSLTKTTESGVGEHV